jgi:WD40 repeat protein
VSLNFDGTLFALASKDKAIRIFDPRANKIVNESEISSTLKTRVIGRNMRLSWCSSSLSFDPIATVSSNNGGTVYFIFTI